MAICDTRAGAKSLWHSKAAHQAFLPFCKDASPQNVSLCLSLSEVFIKYQSLDSDCQAPEGWSDRSPNVTPPTNMGGGKA